MAPSSRRGRVFRVNYPLLGTSAALEVPEFFGGEIGDVGMAIADVPHFAIGDRRVVSLGRLHETGRAALQYSCQVPL